jgi:transposase
MVFEHQHEYPSQWKAIESIAQKLDINRETLRVWVRRAEVDDGRRPGLTTDERARIRELEREVKELRRANEMARNAPTGSGVGPSGARRSGRGGGSPPTASASAWSPWHAASRSFGRPLGQLRVAINPPEDDVEKSVIHDRRLRLGCDSGRSLDRGTQLLPRTPASVLALDSAHVLVEIWRALDRDDGTLRRVTAVTRNHSRPGCRASPRFRVLVDAPTAQNEGWRAHAIRICRAAAFRDKRSQPRLTRQCEQRTNTPGGIAEFDGAASLESSNPRSA